MKRPYATQTIMRTQTVKKPKKNSASIFTPIMIILFVIVLPGGFLGKIYLENKINELNKNSQMLNKKISSSKREIKTLKVRQASYKRMTHISRKIVQFDLGLRKADPEQVRNITLRSKKSLLGQSRNIAYNR